MPPEITEAPSWFAEAVLFLLLALAVLAAVGAAAAWTLAARAKSLARDLARLEKLEGIATTVERLAASHADLDLRRLEHVLIDVRDGQRRVEERLLAIVEASARASVSRAAPGLAALPPGEGGALAERVVTRLVALGYERIAIVTPHAELERLAAADGEVVVEARRDGAPCKGRVVVRGGRVADVQLQSAYSTFP